MSDDIQKEPVSPPRAEPSAEGPEYPDFDYGEEPEYPPLVKAAGVMWIVYGCLILLNMVAVLLLSFVLASQMGGDVAAGAAGGAVCVALFLGLIAAAFLFVGVQSVRGTARDTLGNAVGSIILGVLQFGGAALYGGMGQIVQAGVAAVAGGLLLIAGVLALMGRSDYRRWRQWQKARRDREAAERKARRRFVQ